MTKTRYEVEIEADLLKRARIALRMESGEPVEDVIAAAFQRVITDVVRQHLAWLAGPDNGLDAATLEEMRRPRCRERPGGDDD